MYVNDVFPPYYRVGVGLGGGAFLAGLALGYATGFGGAVLSLLAVALALAAAHLPR